MNTEHITKLKTKLEEEKALLETELKTVGRINPDNPKDWQPTPGNQDVLKADDHEVGDMLDVYEENTAILKPLETRYNEIKKALKKIAEGTGYGVCEICGKEIEMDRLEANPAATTCKEHMNQPAE